MTKLIVAFRNFAEALKNSDSLHTPHSYVSHDSCNKQLPIPCEAFTECSFSWKPCEFSVRHELNTNTELKVHSRHQQTHTLYKQIHLQIAATCFGVTHTIFRELFTKIYNLQQYNRLTSISYYIIALLQPMLTMWIFTDSD